MLSSIGASRLITVERLPVGSAFPLIEIDGLPPPGEICKTSLMVRFVESLLFSAMTGVLIAVFSEDVRAEEGSSHSGMRETSKTKLDPITAKTTRRAPALVF